MINIDKQIAYWRDGAVEDWQVAQDLLQQGRIRHGLFFVHLSIEKLLKAHVCKQTRDLAPRTHNLLRLTEIAMLGLDQSQLDILSDVNSYNIEGRYPEMLFAVPSMDQAVGEVHRAEEVYRWLMNRL